MNKYLVLRKGYYHFRLAIPSDLQDILKKKVIKQSLKTGDKREATKAAKELADFHWNHFNKLRNHNTELDDNTLEIKIKEYTIHLTELDKNKRKSKIKPLTFGCSDIEIEATNTELTINQIENRKYNISEIEASLVNPYYPGPYSNTLEEYTDENGRTVCRYPNTAIPKAPYVLTLDKIQEFIAITGFNYPVESIEYAKIAKSVTEAVLKAEKIALHRDTLDTASEQNLLKTIFSEPIPTHEKTIHKAPITPSLLATIEKYIEIKISNGDWKQTSIKDIAPQLRQFAQLAGTTTPHRRTHQRSHESVSTRHSQPAFRPLYDLLPREKRRATHKRKHPRSAQA